MTRNKIFRQSMTDGKRVFSVEVPITVEYYVIDGKLEEVIPPEASRAIEFAIETTYPGWFHRCYGLNGVDQEDCPACQRGHKPGNRLTEPPASSITDT